MKLLHPEVEIAPGTLGKKFATPTPEREKMSGSVILRLTNDTAQENAYTISLRCDNPFWQESWYTITSWIATGNNTPGGKADVHGHNGRWLKVFVPHGGTRDIFIRFNVPKTPESRAGRYDYTIEVETQITTPQDGMARRKDRLTSIPAVANVRPYYVWSLDLTPEQQRVTRRRRTGEFEVVVTNEGNDWLYCDLQLPRPKDLLLDAPTLRLAVPPPEPGELLPSVGIQEGRPGTQRVVPLLATTRLKLFRGDLTPQPLAVSAQRVHAPSLPPPAEDGYLSLGSVVAMPPTSTEAPQAAAPTDRALVYAPPVPAKFVDFFSRGAGNFRAWIAPLLLAVVAVVAFYALFMRLGRPMAITQISTVSLPKAGAKLTVTGKWILGSKVTFDGKIGSKEIDPVTLDSKPAPVLTGGFDRCVVMVPQSLNGLVGHMTVHRADGLFALFPFFLQAKAPITVGDAVIPPDPPSFTPVDAGPYPVHGSFVISGKNLPSSVFVLVGGQKSPHTDWTPTRITVAIPPTLPISTSVPVSVRIANSSYDAGSINIGVALLPGVGSGSGSGVGSGSGSGSGVGSGSGSGPQIPMPKITQYASGSYRVGQTFRVGISGFPGPGVATLNGSPATPTKWTGDHVTFTVPPGKPGINLIVKLQPTGGGAVLPAGQVSIKAPPVVSPADDIISGKDDMAMAAASANPTKPFNQAIIAYTKAKAEQMNVDDANSAFGKALSTKPTQKEQAVIYYMSAIIEHKNNMGVDANQSYKKAKSLDPHIPALPQ